MYLCMGAQEKTEMSKSEIHQCECSNCQQLGKHRDREMHFQTNLLLSRLDEQQRRWYVALEAKKIGHGGMERMSQITGMSVDTIRRGREELDNSLSSRPDERVRNPGGGRLPVEKNNQA
jgi:hypothetical protein